MTVAGGSYNRQRCVSLETRHKTATLMKMSAYALCKQRVQQQTLAVNAPTIH